MEGIENLSENEESILKSFKKKEKNPPNSKFIQKGKKYASLKFGLSTEAEKDLVLDVSILFWYLEKNKHLFTRKAQNRDHKFLANQLN